MKKPVEIILNILFWIISMWLIIQIFGVESVEIELVEDVEINEATSGLSTSNQLTKTTAYTTRDEVFAYKQLTGFFFKAALFYLNLLVFLPIFFGEDYSLKLSRNKFSNDEKTGEENVWSKIAQLTSPKIQLSIFILVTLALCFVAESLVVSYAFEQSITSYHSGLNLSFYAFYLIISFTYGFMKDWYRSENHNVKLKEEQLVTELNFLKSQINPHFLFNILNNLYSLAAQTDKPELSTGISELSHLMRYMIYESNVEQIALEKEITFLKNMINLNNLSYSEDDDINISFEVKGVSVEHKIAPVILVPFVENAFKHGIDVEKLSYIKINLSIENDILTFEVDNSIHKNTNPISKSHSGIGLSNVRKRLNLLYPERHTLNITEENNEFSIQLKLML